jgi:alpha,alpha-trehalase
VSSHPLQHTLLPLPNPFIIPGSRFVECYYWDSLWVIKGLLTCCCKTTTRSYYLNRSHCCKTRNSNSGEGDDDSNNAATTSTSTIQIHQLVKGMIENFFYCIEKYGFVPNGCRSYYLNRSQPPLLSEMVMALVKHCDDGDDRQGGGTAAEGVSSTTITTTDVVDLPFLQRALDCLLIEHEYWTSSPRCINIAVENNNNDNNNNSGVYRLARYWADWDEPRPESWREDVDTTHGTTHGAIYRDIAAAAESGWDFSSRWLKDGTALSTIETTNIIPVDLNAYLYQMESNIVKLADKVGREEVGGEYKELARLRKEAVERLFWDEGQWRDLRITKRDSGENSGDHHHNGGHHDMHHHRVHVYGKDVVHKESTGIYASNWIPLACGCVEKNSKDAVAAVESLVKSGLLSAPGGVATTLHKTGQQWDWPNAWPPIQCLLEEGCRLYGGDVGGRVAGDIGRRYLKSAYLGWKGSGGDGGGGGVMFEKFDVERVGVAGGGGEYECASGFGWTNGVALVFLSRYGGY